jgi:hypothetical protein
LPWSERIELARLQFSEPLPVDSDRGVILQASEHASKSVLLEIAKEPNRARQLELWQRAQTGELTARKAREAKGAGSPASQKAAKATIELAEAKIVIRFRAGQATPDRVARCWSWRCHRSAGRPD